MQGNKGKKKKTEKERKKNRKAQTCFTTHDLLGKERKKEKNFKGICSMMDENPRVIEKK